MAINFNYNYPQIAREGGFKLRQYKDGPIDWRILGSIEIERLLQDQRLEQVDTLLTHLSEAPLATMLDTNILDSGIAKYFIVSQFAIQYLLFCRKFLDETIRDLREAHAESQMDVAKLRKSLAEANNEILQLHKKITQIEAIHEVVYPCHLCTKSFISNEALNIHISRRHAARLASSAVGMGNGVGATGAGVSERHTDTPPSAATKDREHNDLQLINAIKLELEIKQLKERLNNAERDIRERSVAASNSRRATPREPTKTLKSVAIQSELLETKEQDDGAEATLNNIDTDSSEVRERKAQLCNLQAKIQDFQAWRESQQVNNEESIAEINRKLNEIVHTLEVAKATPSVAPITTITAVQSKTEDDGVETPAPLLGRGSPSVEDLERLLTQKVVEIGQKSAEKLEEFVQSMEANYKEKLEELEREIKRRNAAELARGQEMKTDGVVEVAEMKIAVAKTPALATSTPQINVRPQDITYTAFNPTESDSSLSVEPKPEPAKRMPRFKRVPLTVTESNPVDQAKGLNETFAIKVNEDGQMANAVKPKPRVRKIQNVESAASSIKNTHGDELYSLSTESNRTFVKAEKAAGGVVKEKATEKIPHDDKDNDSTDITETLSSESESDGSSSSKSELEPTPKVPAKVKQKRNLKKSTEPKPFTRNDAKRAVNKRLIASGLDPNIDGISAGAMKRLNTELAEKRHKLKQEYPNFYATRNKIKKLVDKLCSTKLPAPVEDMLKHSKPIRPKTAYNVQRQQREDVQLHSNVDSFEALEVTSTSTPLQTPQSLRENDMFKQRLERIFASPMRQPHFDNSSVGGEQQQHQPAIAQPTRGVPVPLTRKRVMFNTLSQNSGESGGAGDAEVLRQITSN